MPLRIIACSFFALALVYFTFTDKHPHKRRNVLLWLAFAAYVPMKLRIDIPHLPSEALFILSAVFLFSWMFLRFKKA
jgi:hypothetical protein